MTPLLGILIGLALAGQPSDEAALAAAHQQAQAWGKAFHGADAGKMADLTHPAILKKFGSRDPFIERVRQADAQLKKRFKITAFTVLPAKEVHRAGKALIVFLPTRIDAQGPNGKVVGQDHVIGASADAGKTWTIIDRDDVNDGEMLLIFPDWPAKLRLPPLGKTTEEGPPAEVYTSAKGNYKVSYPKGWKKVSAPGADDLRLNRDRQVILVLLDFDNQPPEEMLKILLTNVQNGDKGAFKERERGKTRIAGVDALSVQFETSAALGPVDARVVIFENQGITYRIVSYAPKAEVANLNKDLSAVFAGFAFLGKRKEWQALQDSKPAPVVFLAGLASLELSQPRWHETTLAGQPPRGGADGPQEELYFSLKGGAGMVTVQASERRTTAKAELEALKQRILPVLQGGTAKRVVFKGPKGFVVGVEMTGILNQGAYFVLGCAFAKDGLAVQLVLEGPQAQRARLQKDWEQMLATFRFADPKTTPPLFSLSRYGPDNRPPHPGLAVLLKKATVLYPGERMHDVHSISADGQQALLLTGGGVFVETLRDQSRIALSKDQQSFGPNQPLFGIPASWSRDGKQIAYATGQAVVVRPLAGKEVAEHKGRATALAFLADNRLLVAHGAAVDAQGRQPRFVQQKLVRYDEDDAQPVLTFPLARFGRLAVAPDGKQVALVTNKDNARTSALAGNLYVANADGTDLRQLTKGPENILSVAWSDDGRSLYVVRRETRTSAFADFRPGDLYRVAVDTGEMENLTRCGKIAAAWVQGDHFLLRVQGDSVPMPQTGIYKIAAAELARAAATLPAPRRDDVSAAAKQIAGRIQAAFAPRPLAEVVPTPEILAKLADTFATAATELLGAPFDYSAASLDALPGWTARLEPTLTTEPALLYGVGAYYGETLRKLAKAEWRLEPVPLGNWIPGKGNAPINAVTEVVLPFTAVFRSVGGYADDEGLGYMLMSSVRLKQDRHKLVLAYPPASAERALRTATAPAYLQAYEHFDKGEIAAGLKRLAPLVREYPDNAQLALDALDLAATADSSALADQMARDAVAAGSTLPEWLVRHADTLVKSDPQKALDLYRKAAHGPLPSAAVYLKLGKQLAAMGQRPLAEMCFRRAWAIGSVPQQAEARTLLVATTASK